MSENKKHRVILSGGGTAGHIYPAVAIAERLEERYGKDNVEILFVGAKGKMEMTKVPALGYKIIGLPIVGLRRSLSLKNLALPFLLLKSYLKAFSIIRNFKPDVVVGFGGYASVPILKCAQTKHIRTMLWEGNSFAGMANRMLGKKAEAIFVSYDKMDRFFKASKLVKSGNPLRGDIFRTDVDREDACSYFGFSGKRPIVMVTGGSLGARVLNESVLNYINKIVEDKEIDLIWQVGSYYEKEMLERIEPIKNKMTNVWLGAFINKMDYAYAISDVIIGRGGASTISELALLGKTAIIVPSSVVAEDHQTKNAMSLKEAEAIDMISDADAPQKLIPFVLELVSDEPRMAKYRKNIKKFAVPNSADIIVDTFKL